MFTSNSLIVHASSSATGVSTTTKPKMTLSQPASHATSFPSARISLNIKFLLIITSGSSVWVSLLPTVPFPIAPVSPAPQLHSSYERHATRSSLRRALAPCYCFFQSRRALRARCTASPRNRAETTILLLFFFCLPNLLPSAKNPWRVSDLSTRPRLDTRARRD
jgi:hypothetical protein